jgi:hypothetical protein
LYLAIPDTIYQEMLLRPFYQKRLDENHVKLIIVDVVNEIIVKWKI